MDWVKSFLFVIAFTSGLIQVRRGRVYSNGEVAQRYEQCVLNKLSRSQSFTEEDVLNAVKIVKETNNRMQILHLDLTNTSNLRTLLRLFATSMANLVADNHIPKNFQKKEDFLCAIEMCSLSLPQLIGDELIREVTKIFAAMRNDEKLYVSNGVVRAQPRAKKSLTELSSESVVFEGNSLTARHKRSPPLSIFHAFTSGVQYQPLEVIISNILKTSPAFFNTFKMGMIRQNAINIATNMIATGLEDYEFGVVSKAQDAATNTMLRFNSNANTSDYAFAIANAIVSVLKVHQLDFLADGNEIANALIQKLQNMQRADTSLPLWPQSSETRSRQIQMRVPALINPAIGQAPITYPDTPTAKPPFQSTLELLLSQSSVLRNAFRNGYFSGVFGMVQDALSDYEFFISVEAANSIFSSLVSMAPNVVRDQYGSVIAKIITETLLDNDSLQNADARSLVRKMESKIREITGIHADTVQNQQGAQPFSFSFDEHQENPTFFPQFSNSGGEVPPSQSKINPESIARFGDMSGSFFSQFPTSKEEVLPVQSPINSESVMPFGDTSKTFFPQFPSSEVQVPAMISPINPESMTPFGDMWEIPEYPIQFPDYIPFPLKETDILNKSPDINPSFDFVIPEAPFPDFEDTEEKAVDSSFALKPTNQEKDFSSFPIISGGADRVPSDIPHVPMNMTSVNNGSKLDNGAEEISPTVSHPFNFEASLEISPSISDDDSPSAQEYVPLRIEYSFTDTMATPSPLQVTSTTVAEYATTQRSTSVDTIEPTSPLYTTSTIASISDGRNAAEELLEKIHSAIRAMDMAPKTDKPIQTSSSVPGIETTPAPIALESTTTGDQSDKSESISNMTTAEVATDEVQNVNIASKELQPSFSPTAEPTSSDKPLDAKYSNNGAQSTETMQDGVVLSSSKLMLTDRIMFEASSAIALIRSGQASLPDLCKKLNQLAPIVDIPPLDVCNELALIDYILNVLIKATSTLRRM